MIDRIKYVRSALGLTQEQFASKIGLSRNYVAKIEIGNREPSDRTISDICREFGVTGAGEPFAPPSRADEMGRLVKSLMADKPETFRTRLITALLRLDPDGPEWGVLEDIYNSLADEN